MSIRQTVTEGYYALKDLPKGELIKRKASAKKVYVKGDYDRASKTYSLYDYMDINSEVFAHGGAKVYAGFTY